MSAAPALDLPYGRQLIEADDVAAVAAALNGDWLTTGPTVDAFERAFAARVGAPHAVACANGTAALHLAALALGLGPGDVVVVPTVTFLATANAVRFVGAEVAFADVDPDTGLMTAESFDAALARAGAAAKAVFPVHLAGQTAPMDDIATLARSRELAMVEDACHALGGSDGAAPVGACRTSDMATFSFHPVKAIACGEGGMTTTRRDDLAERLRRMRSHGIVRDADRFSDRERALDGEGRANPWYYEMPEPGFNYRLSDLNCALGLSQLAKLDRFVAARDRLAARYDAALAPLAPVVEPLRRRGGDRPAWHIYAARVDFAAAGRPRGAVMRALAEEGVRTQVHYIPVHRQPYYVRRYGRLDLPGAERYYARTLTLPLHVGMNESQVDAVAAALGRALGLVGNG